MPNTRPSRGASAHRSDACRSSRLRISNPTSALDLGAGRCQRWRCIVRGGRDFCAICSLDGIAPFHIRCVPNYPNSPIGGTPPCFRTRTNGLITKFGQWNPCSPRKKPHREIGAGPWRHQESGCERHLSRYRIVVPSARNRKTKSSRPLDMQRALARRSAFPAAGCMATRRPDCGFVAYETGSCAPRQIAVPQPCETGLASRDGRTASRLPYRGKTAGRRA